MYYLNETEKFSNIFNFGDKGESQDWDLIFANSKRIEEFIDYYRNNELNEDEKITLMALIIASFDDYLNEKNENSNKIWEEISILINHDRILLEGIIYNWSLLTHIEEFNRIENLDKIEDEDVFAITPYIRKTFYDY